MQSRAPNEGRTRERRGVGRGRGCESTRPRKGGFAAAQPVRRRRQSLYTWFNDHRPALVQPRSTRPGSRGMHRAARRGGKRNPDGGGREEGENGGGENRGCRAAARRRRRQWLRDGEEGCDRRRGRDVEGDDRRRGSRELVGAAHGPVPSRAQE